MEDLGDIKMFRKNLMFISIITIIIFIFSSNIKEINIFGIIKLDNINSYKTLIILLTANIYVLLRYKQYLFKNDIKLNKKILIFDIINNKYFQNHIVEAIQMKTDGIDEDNNGFMYSVKKIYKKNHIQSIEYNDVLLLNYNFKDGDENYGGTSLFCYGGITDSNIDGGFYGNNNDDNINIYLHNNNKNRHDDNISIEYKNNKIILFFLKLRFYIKEHYFIDYYIPILLGIIAIELIIIKITYLLHI